MRRFLLWLGLTVVTVAAVAASFSTLAGLAAFTGWGERLSWLLPASLDALGMTACLVWLDGSADRKSRDYARWLTWVAAGLSILGNGVGHLASTGHLSQGLLLVVLVGAVPPAALATTVHLIVLVSSPSPVPVPVAAAVPVPDAAPVLAAKPKPTAAKPGKPKTAPRPKPSPTPVKSGPESGPKVDDLTIQKARNLDHEYQAKHGKPIPRDEAQKKLGVSNEKTSEALRLAREEVA
jgi:Protein of unknown function (DUF2637)